MFCQLKKLIRTNARNKRRVVVTGLGIVCPLGVGVQNSWQALIDSKCSIVKLEDKRFEVLPCRIAATVPKGTGAAELNITKHFPKTVSLRSMCPATVYALIAAEEALTNANWKPENETDKENTGVAVGIGMIDLENVCDTNEIFQKRYARVSPFFVPRLLPNMAAGEISIKYGFRGPNYSVSTACATGAHAIGDGFRFIRNGDADVMVCGGAEASINPLALAGFCRMKALSTSRNDAPQQASRPFDKDRDGFVMGEGSAILILEELNHALERNASIYAEILGYGLSGDASHITAPCEDGRGAFLAMQRAITDAGVAASDIGFVNAHATSTPLGDAIEVKAISSLMKEHSRNVTVSSTKGAHGHLLGSAGNLEASFTILAVKEGILPPTLNLHESEFQTKLNFVPNVKKSWDSTKRIALKNSFGFGGTNASLCIGQYIE